MPQLRCRILVKFISKYDRVASLIKLLWGPAWGRPYYSNSLAARFCSFVRSACAALLVRTRLRSLLLVRAACPAIAAHRLCCCCCACLCALGLHVPSVRVFCGFACLLLFSLVFHARRVRICSCLCPCAFAFGILLRVSFVRLSR